MALTATQQSVLDKFTAGMTLPAAASALGIDTETAVGWTHINEFRNALRNADDARRQSQNPNVRELIAEAFGVLRTIMLDPEASSSVRLRAALALIERAVTFPLESVPKSEPVHNPDVHNPAQPGPAQTGPAKHGPVHVDKIGRNELCPCGSGIKYKRCCLGKPAPAPQPAVHPVVPGTELESEPRVTLTYGS